MLLKTAHPIPRCLLPASQEFVTHECDTSEMGAGRFSARDVHRIGILDLRLFNTDRHSGNMLVRAAVRWFHCERRFQCDMLNAPIDARIQWHCVLCPIAAPQPTYWSCVRSCLAADW